MRINSRRFVAVLFVAGLSRPATGTHDPFTDADFVHVRPGTFQMGDSSLDNSPRHTVTLKRGYWMQTTPVTQEQWKAVMGTNPSGHQGCPTCPIENVNYSDVLSFIVKLNAYSTGKTYRLPDEVEWEYAARAGTTGDYGVPGAVTAGGWIDTNSGGMTHPVGRLRPNAWGLYDMEGNVWEWVGGAAARDPHDFNAWLASHSLDPVTDPRLPKTGNGTGGVPMLRGGSYYNPAALARSAYRMPVELRGAFNIGFRLVREE